MEATQLEDEPFDLDLDKVEISGNDTQLEITILPNAIRLNYALDKGNTGVTRMDAEWIGSKFFIPEGEGSGPAEPKFKIQFEVDYKDSIGANYDPDTTTTTAKFIKRDTPLVRPFVLGVENGKSYSIDHEDSLVITLPSVDGKLFVPSGYPEEELEEDGDVKYVELKAGEHYTLKKVDGIYIAGNYEVDATDSETNSSTKVFFTVTAP